jgi:hypothetical protein
MFFFASSQSDASVVEGEPRRMLAADTGVVLPPEASEKEVDASSTPTPATTRRGNGPVGEAVVDIPAYLGDFRSVKRRRKYTDAEKPKSTLASGFGDRCFANWPAAAQRQPTRRDAPACLPDPEASAVDRCIASRREMVLASLDRRNWTIEVWFMAGRQGYLPITPRYLRPMLRAHGGVAARVVWLYEEWQAGYIERYAKDHFSDLVRSGAFELAVRGNIRRMYRRSLNNPRTLVVKIDDDTVFIQPHSLTAMFAEMLRDDSRCVVVSGNVVNHVGLNPVHAALGALDVQRSAKQSPLSVSRHRMEYDGYQRNVLGSYQLPIEWRQAHVDLLTAVRDDQLERFYFPSQAMPSTNSAVHCPIAQRTFDFQCDGMWRRWGINLVAFPALSSPHFSAMRDLGHWVKNKDEVYFTMEMGRHVDGPRNHTCAVSDAVAVHFLNTGQASNLRRVLGLGSDGKGSDPRVHDASLIAPALLELYRAVAEHHGGVKRCCRDTGCPLFNTTWPRDPNVLFPLP